MELGTNYLKFLKRPCSAFLPKAPRYFSSYRVSPPWGALFPLAVGCEVHAAIESARFGVGIIDGYIHFIAIVPFRRNRSYVLNANTKSF